LDDHLKWLVKVIEVLNQNNLKINFEKSEFCQKSLKLLGYVFEDGKYKIDQDKLVNFCNDGVRPTNGKQLQRLIGFCNFFRNFIPSFADIMKVFDSLKGNSIIIWDDVLESRLKLIKELIAKSGCLVYPNFKEKLELYCDASSVGISAVLKQKSGLIGFASRVLKNNEINYSVVKRELLAISFSMEYFSEYLLGNHFLLYTDNRSLLFILNIFTNRIQKNSEYFKNMVWIIQRYSFTIIHVSAKNNYFADILSRLPNSTSSNVLLVNQKKDFTNLDNIKKMIEIIHSWGHFSFAFISSYLKIIFGIVIDKSVSKLIEDCIGFCKVCKTFNVGSYGFAPIKNLLAEYPMDKLCLDILYLNNQDSTDDGNKFILVLVDTFTRYVFLYAVPSKSAVEVAKCLLNLISNFGFFNTLVSDQGKEFDNKLFKLIQDYFKINHVFTSLDYKMDNGLVERNNRTVVNVILKICRERCANIKNWDKLLDITQFSINQKINHLYSSNPFSVFHGRCGFNKNQLSGFGLDVKVDNLNFEKYEDLVSLHLKNWIGINKFIYENIEDRIKDSKCKENLRIDKRRKVKEYAVNEIVMVKLKLINKIDPRWIGPLKIGSKTVNGNFNLVCKGDVIAYSNVPSIFLGKCKFFEKDVLSELEFKNFNLNEEQVAKQIVDLNKEEVFWNPRKEGLRNLKKIDFKKQQ
jgi:hypothetical protein